MGTVRLPIVCTLLLLSALPAAAGRHALLIGCNNGGPTVEPLRWAEADAHRFSDVLNRLGGFHRPDITTLTDPDSTALERELRKVTVLLRSSPSPENDLFLLYYSGHADGTNVLLGPGRFPLKNFRKLLDSLPTGITIAVFDACQSGAITAFKGGSRAEPFFSSTPPKIKGQVIISSTTASQRAQESETLKSSLFTFHWLTGLRGSADQSGDRRVSLDEAYRYAYRKTLETSTLTAGEAQHPMYRFAIQGQGDITLTDLTDKTNGILFDRTCEGSFLVLSDLYTDIFADFSKQKNSEWFVALEPGIYRVINAFDRDVGMRNIEITPAGKTVRFSRSMLLPIERSRNSVKGPGPTPADTITPPTTRPLSTYSWGVGSGALVPVGAKAPDEATQAIFAFSNLLYVNNRCNLFLDVIGLTGGLNGGALAGADLLTLPEKWRAYAGIGGGLFHFEKETGIVPALTAHAGFVVDAGQQLQIAIQTPYLVSFGNGGIEHRLGLELKVLATGRYRNIKALEY
ncbi:MAG: caspase family protein [Chitinispirillaceae bacterium]|nr:caspase family protein [Chitinispirillaceae bacterium]